MIFTKGHAPLETAVSEAHQFGQLSLGLVPKSAAHGVGTATAHAGTPTTAESTAHTGATATADRIATGAKPPLGYSFSELQAGPNTLRDISALTAGQNAEEKISAAFKIHRHIRSHHRILERKLAKLETYRQLSPNAAIDGQIRTLKNLKENFENHALFDRENIANVARNTAAYGGMRALADKAANIANSLKIYVREHRPMAVTLAAGALGLKVAAVCVLFDMFNGSKKTPQAKQH